jgi:MSHA biogenesis protein MshO
MYNSYAISASQLSSIAALNAIATARVLADNVTTCQISYTTGVLQRSGIVTIYLGITQDSAKANLMHQVNVVNSP